MTLIALWNRTVDSVSLSASSSKAALVYPKVGTVGRHSSKSVLVSPTPGELAKLAHHSRGMPSRAVPVEAQEVPVRSLRRRLPPQAIQELVARYNGGEDTPALSRGYGISKTRLLHLFHEEGVSLRRRAFTPGDAERAVRLYERGLMIDQGVGQVGYSLGTVQRTLHEHGVAMRATGIGKRAMPDER